MQTKTKTVNLPPDIHKALKQVALDRDTTITALIVQAMPRILQDGPKDVSEALIKMVAGSCPACGRTWEQSNWRESMTRETHP